jgi:putative tryptophan/tyrosine transport system substrate-binding protein
LRAINRDSRQVREKPADYWDKQGERMRSDLMMAGGYRFTVHLVLPVIIFAALAWATESPARDGPRHIGWLDPNMTPTAQSPSGAQADFEQRLRELGYVPGQDYVLESRFSDTYWDKLPEMARDLVARRVDVIVTIGTRTVLIAKQATATIPIVMGGAGEPLELKLVPSLAHPGGNVTGVAHNPGPEFAGKSLELLKDASPKISRVAILWDSGALHEDPSLDGQRVAAEALGLTLLIHDIVDAHSDEAFDQLLATVAKENPDAVFVYPNFISTKHAGKILAFAAEHRLPSMFQNSDYANKGALFSHYADWHALRRRTADYVDKVLKGADPGDLPVEQPQRFDLVINLKTAKALGLTMSQSILLRAEKVIE